MRGRDRLWLRAALAGSAAAGGCGAADAPPIVTLVRDSAGVVIVENRAPAAEWRLSEAAELRVGVIEGDPAQQLNRVVHAARLADGGVVVANGGTLELRYFDQAGRHLVTAGRRGGGPREFSDFTSLVLGAGDTLLVYDWRNRRITSVAPDGAIVQELPAEWTGLFASGPVALLGMRSDGRALIAEGPATDVSVLRTGYRLARDSVRVVAVALNGSAADTLSRMPAREHLVWMDQRDGRWISVRMDLPFGHTTHHALVGERLVRAATDRDQLELLDADGTLRRIVRRVDAATMPVSEADRERYVAEVRTRAQLRNTPNAAMVVDGARDQVEHLPAGQLRPAFDRVLTDAAGRIWVRDFVPLWAEGEPQHWIVFDAEGVALARVTTPAGLHVLHIGADHVTGVTRDELDVEYVEVHRLQRED